MSKSNRVLAVSLSLLLAGGVWLPTGANAAPSEAAALLEAIQQATPETVANTIESPVTDPAGEDTIVHSW